MMQDKVKGDTVLGELNEIKREEIRLSQDSTTPTR